MPKLLFVVALMAGLVFAQSPTITSVVNGGDFSFGIAQGGFGTIFGTGLSDKEYVGQSVPYAAKLGKTEVRFCVGSGASRAAWDNCLVSGVVYAGPGQVNFRAPIPLITSEPVGSFVLRRDGIEAVAAPSLLFRRKPSVFFVGFDCDYEPSTGDPTPCGLRSTRANVTNSIRGAITDIRGAVVTSLNPARAEGWYTIWLTGMGPISNGRTVYEAGMRLDGIPVYGLPGRTFQLISPAFSGESPQFPGLNQFNFQLPKTLLGSRLFPCGQTFKLDLALTVFSDFGNTNTAAEYVELPVLIQPGDVACQ